MFLHAGWLHLISNMLFLWVFADNVEDAFGYFAFVLFYLLCGIAGALAHVLMSPDSPAPLIGASGAVSGVIGAYALLYPKARVWILLFFRIPLRISAIWVLGGWFLLQIFSVLTAEQSPKSRSPGGPISAAFWRALPSLFCCVHGCLSAPPAEARRRKQMRHVGGGIDSQ